MPRRNFDKPYLDFDGKQVEEKGKPVFLKSIVVDALSVFIDKDANLNGEQRYGLYKLASRVHNGGEQDYTIEELATIKERCGRVSLTMAFGRVCEELDNEPVVAKDPPKEDAAP